MAGLPERRNEASVGIGDDRRPNFTPAGERVQPQLGQKADVRFAAMNF